MSMLGVLSLAMAEKVLNTAIATDTFTQDALTELSGKSLRIVIHRPEIALDVLLGDDRVRFEPVMQSIFEPQGGQVITPPDCTVTVDDPSHLLELIQNPVGNLPISGDYQVLMRAKTIFEHFEPDIWYQLEQVIGTDLTSHLYMVGRELSPVFAPIMQTIKQSVTSLVSPIKPATNAFEEELLDQRIFDKKQELLRLQADIERSQAKLAQLQNQLD
ncbi:hypothetical protein NKT77_11345 [Moraxella sp. FZLJ2107]|uniref:hypothetical protein n=1 Tax=unclassified Moraxella TaxID=2685852 RepID=UPI0020C836D8|nr:MULTISPECIES: hypothetical protein [unclassified Moraxella]UTO05059.1 hypothetical protein NKT77_11345 [Moraxella sp. FZLJ2107]UTO21794.1 hypothetical protein NKU06_08160 [Moraxella sp. FZLJ2109]